MKHLGNKYEYERQRDENLMRVYRALLSGAPADMPQSDIYQLLVHTPCERFWVSEERAIRVISKMETAYHATLRHMSAQKRRMYREIYHRSSHLMEQKGMSRREAVCEVVASPAPEFYLTPGSAEVILCRIKKKVWYLERKRKLRHLS